MVCRKQWGVEWRVRLVFPQAALEYSEERYVCVCVCVCVCMCVCVCVCMCVYRVCEDWLIADVLKRYIHPSDSDPVIRHR